MNVSPDLLARPIVVRRPYEPRHIGFHQLVQADDWLIKVYAVAPHGRTVSESFLDAALEAARQALPAPAAGEGRHGVGFVIAHDAPQMAYVLVCWWAEENEVHQRLLSAPAGRLEQLAPHPSEAIGCVWELSVTDHERRWWLTDVLANPAGPDIGRYLSRQLHEDI